MKYLLLITLFCISLFGANVDTFAKEAGYERDFQTALQKAKKANKPLMMVLGADYCPWCRKFERKTLESKAVKNFIKDETIALVVDKKFDIESFPKAFQTSITPRVFFIDPATQKSFYQTAGYIKKKEYLKKLKEMKTQFKAK